MANSSPLHSVAIACGGTGGHLFPGLAIAEKLAEKDVDITLIVSRKEVDQQAIKDAGPFKVLSLPAVGLTRGRWFSFVRGFWESYRATLRVFKHHTPDAVLAMGGFTSVPPVLAGKSLGAATFLHESNSIPGRANRWLGRVVELAFLGFPSAASKLSAGETIVTGTPVRKQIQQRDEYDCRRALGLDPTRPVILVVGGSQGARGVNQIVARSLPMLGKLHKHWQWFHIAGCHDAPHLQPGYTNFGLSAIVHSFFNKMELALGAATVAISRAGASSLAELAVVRLPSLLVPYPTAMDNHQWHNAREYVTTGAACMLQEKDATPAQLTKFLAELVQDQTLRQSMQSSLAKWDRPDPAVNIAQRIFQSLERRNKPVRRSVLPSPIQSIPFETAGSGEPRSMVRSHPRVAHKEQPARI